MASSYGRDFLNRSSKSRFQEFLLARIARNQWTLIRQKISRTPSHVIEVGPGVGRFARQVISTAGTKYSGYEGDEELLAHLQKELPGYVSRGVLPSVESAIKAELVHSAHVLEHASTYLEGQKWLENLITLVSSEGHVSLIVPDYDYWGSMFWDDPTHGFPTNEARLGSLLVACNMARIQLIRIYGGKKVMTGPLRDLVGLLLKLFCFLFPKSRRSINSIRQAYFTPHLLLIAKKL